MHSSSNAFPFRHWFLAVALVVSGDAAQAADWPEFLGPTRNCLSPETTLLDKFPAEGPPLLWEKAVGTGYSAPSVRAGKAVIFHRQGLEEVVECITADAGKPVWRHAYRSLYEDPFGYNNGPRCTPLITSNRVFTFGAEGVLTCLDFADGKVVWQRKTALDWRVPEAFFGVGSTPVLEDNRLFVMVGGQPNAGMVALDATTGKTLWENVGEKTWSGVTTTGWRAEAPYAWTGEEKQASYSTPVLATFHGQRHLLCFMRQGLVSLNPTNGEARFKRWFQSVVNDSVNAINPVVDGETILLSAAYYRIGSVLLKVNPDGKSFEEVWRIPKSTGERLPEGGFREPTLEVHWSTPVLHQGFLYAFSGRNEPDATFRCVELKTGAVKWSRDERWRGHPPRGAKAQPDVFGRGSAILADGKLITLGEGGLLGLVKPNPEKLEEISRFQVPSLGYPCWVAPVLSAGRLYLRSEDRLVCYGLGR